MQGIAITVLYRLNERSEMIGENMGYLIVTSLAAISNVGQIRVREVHRRPEISLDMDCTRVSSSRFFLSS
jgi:hypothetical protein